MPVILERDWIIADYLISNSGNKVVVIAPPSSAKVLSLSPNRRIVLLSGSISVTG